VDAQQVAGRKLLAKHNVGGPVGVESLEFVAAGPAEMQTAELCKFI